MSDLPAALAPLVGMPHWVVWRWEIGKTGKRTKVPYQPTRPRLKAKNNDRSSWASYETARQVADAGRADGVGFCLLGSPFAAFDLDDCRDPETGKVSPWAQALVNRVGSYTEVTVSGTGLRIIGTAAGSEVHRKQPSEDGGTIETYRQAARYIVMTGNVLPETPQVLRDIDVHIDEVVAELDAKKKTGRTPRPSTSKPRQLGYDAEVDDIIKNGCGDRYGGDRSKAVWRVINDLVRSGHSEDAIASVLLEKDNRISDHLYDQADPEGYARKQIAKAIAQKPNRPVINVESGEIAFLVNKTQEALIAANRPILNHGRVLVEPIYTPMPTSRGREVDVTVFQPMEVENLTYMTNRWACDYVRYDKREKKEARIDPPEKVMKTLLKLGHWGFPRVFGIINVPTLRPDGTILDQPGFDAATHLWHAPDRNLKLPPVPERPTKEQADKALSKFKDLFAECAFVSDLDQSVALAAVLGAVLRGAFELMPMTLFKAHSPGSGKSYIVDIISHLVTGTFCPVVAYPSERKELDKLLDAMIIQSPPIFSIDNATDHIGGDKLCQMVERPTVTVRILGKSKTRKCEFRGTVYATANNYSFYGDMVRRGLICNLDVAMERPELRKFDFNPIERVLASRGEYIVAALTVARAYLATRKRVNCSPLGSYDGWSQFVREPLIWLGEDDPVKSMDQARADDPVSAAARTLVDLWAECLEPGRPYKVAEIIALATETAMSASSQSYERPELRDLLLQEANERNRPTEISGKRLGKWLARINGQVHGQWRVMRAAKDDRRGDDWVLEKKPTPKKAARKQAA